MISADTYIEKALYALLSAHQPLTDVIADNIDSDVASDRQAAAYVVYHVISDLPVNIKKSVSPVEVYRVQIDAYAQSRDLVSKVVRLARQALEQKTGTYGGMYVAQIKFEDYNGTFQEGPQTFKGSADYMVRAHN